MKDIKEFSTFYCENMQIILTDDLANKLDFENN